jgi:hypothetical protein
MSEEGVRGQPVYGAGGRTPDLGPAKQTFSKGMDPFLKHCLVYRCLSLTMIAPNSQALPSEKLRSPQKPKSEIITPSRLDIFSAHNADHQTKDP